MMLIKKKKGFSLLELILVLGIAMVVSFIKFQDLRNEQDNILASAVGQQIKQVGDAVNGYINIHYDKLSTLTSSKSESTDPGPRICNAGTNSCTITYKTLANEGLLPATFNGTNANHSEYTIILRRDGTSPNYIINGIVTTNNAWAEGNKIRYDLLGKAMQSAGVDSGMSKSSSTISGYSGSWSENSSNYSNINKVGILGYRVGYDSSMYSVFLRRDGTLPMTGDLNMGDQNIKNANNITAAGNIVNKGVSQPSGMWGGVSAPDFYANGGLYISSNPSSKNWAIQANRDGYFAATGNINAGGSVTAGNWVWAKNGYGDTIGLGGDNAGNDYEIRLQTGKPLTIFSPNSASNTNVLQIGGNAQVNGRLSTNNLDPNNIPSGWGGGLRTWDVYAGGTIGAGDSSGNVKAYMNSSGQIVASGNISGDTLQVTSNNNIGSWCDTNGKISKNSAGLLLSCYKNSWQPIGEQPGTIKLWAGAYPPSGWLELNGQSFNINSNPILAGIFPNGYLSDTRGYFIRGWDHGRGLDPDSNRGNQSVQEDAIRNITGSVALNLGGHPWRVNHSGAYSVGQTVSGDAGKPGGNTDDLLNFDASKVVPTASENRPKNMALMYIIKEG